MPIFLDVPYSEKDEAKRLGAKWNSNARKWYVPEGCLLSSFEPWLPFFEPTERTATSPSDKAMLGQKKREQKGRKSKEPAKKTENKDRIDSIIGKTIVGSKYFDTAHNCIPWIHCELCAEAMAQRRRIDGV